MRTFSKVRAENTSWRIWLIDRAIFESLRLTRRRRLTIGRTPTSLGMSRTYE